MRHFVVLTRYVLALVSGCQLQGSRFSPSLLRLVDDTALRTALAVLEQHHGSANVLGRDEEQGIYRTSPLRLCLNNTRGNRKLVLVEVNRAVGVSAI